MVAKAGLKQHKNKWTHGCYHRYPNSKDKTLPVVNWQRKKKEVKRMRTCFYVCKCIYGWVGVRECAFYAIVIIECELLICSSMPLVVPIFYGLTTKKRTHTHIPNFVHIFFQVFFFHLFQSLMIISLDFFTKGFWHSSLVWLIMSVWDCFWRA